MSEPFERLVTSGDGGFALERSDGDHIFEQIEFWEDGEAEIIRWEAGKVVSRTPLGNWRELVAYRDE